MPRSISTEANVILTFDGDRDQMFYDAPLVLSLPVDDFDAFEVETIRQVLAPVPADQLGDLLKISLQYSLHGQEDGEPLAMYGDAEIKEVMGRLHHHNGKYYFQPNQRDDYEQRVVDALGIASNTRDPA